MDILALLRDAKNQGASDLHLVVGSAPLFRINGGLRPLDNAPLLTPEEISRGFLQITSPDEREHFHRSLELDFALTHPPPFFPPRPRPPPPPRAQTGSPP